MCGSTQHCSVLFLVEVFLNLFLCSLLISVWMFSRSLSGIQWRLPCRVPWSPAVRLSERPAEECRLKCDVWEEKVLLVFTFCHLPGFFQSLFLSPLSLSLHASLCQAVSSWFNLIILTVSKDDPIVNSLSLARPCCFISSWMSAETVRYLIRRWTDVFSLPAFNVSVRLSFNYTEDF